MRCSACIARTRPRRWPRARSRNARRRRRTTTPAWPSCTRCWRALPTRRINPPWRSANARPRTICSPASRCPTRTRCAKSTDTREAPLPRCPWHSSCNVVRALGYDAGMPGNSADSTISLALQGGGAHGAFTWGVLDYLIEEGSLDFDGISATSSGAMNACALTQGWLDGKRDGARAMLANLWESIGAQASLMRWAFASPAGAATERILLGLTRYFTPQEMNPLGINPVKNIAASLFDFDKIRKKSPFKLFIAATRVRDGRLMLFDNANLTRDALIASTCLPQLFAAVE